MADRILLIEDEEKLARSRSWRKAQGPPPGFSSSVRPEGPAFSFLPPTVRARP